VRPRAVSRLPDRALPAHAQDPDRGAGGGTFDEAEIDRSPGRIVWEATFTRTGDEEVEVTIDAGTGGVLAVRHDD
jgi:uncharacterized membrane protein YkoI